MGASTKKRMNMSMTMSSVSSVGRARARRERAETSEGASMSSQRSGILPSCNDQLIHARRSKVSGSARVAKGIR